MEIDIFEALAEQVRIWLGEKDPEETTESLQNIANSYALQFATLWIDWIPALEYEYPDSGLYEYYLPRYENEYYNIFGFEAE